MAGKRVIIPKSNLIDALTEAGSISKASAILGYHRQTVKKEMQRYGLTIDEFEREDLSHEEVDETCSDTGERRIERGIRDPKEFLSSIEFNEDTHRIVEHTTRLIPAYEKEVTRNAAGKKTGERTDLIDYWMQRVRIAPRSDEDPRVIRAEVMAQLKAAAPKAPKLYKPTRKKDPTMAVVGLFDFHLGMPGWVDLAEAVFARVVKDAIEQTRRHNVTVFQLIVGQDFLHYDGNDKRTNVHYTKGGTPQDTAEIGFLELRARAQALFRWAINELKKHAHVRVAWVPGNHDWLSSLSVFECIRCIFENDAGVSFIDPNEEGRAIIEFGGTRILTAHGDKVKGKQMVQNLIGFAKDAFFGSDYFEVLTGHLHNEIVTHEANGVVWRQLGSAGGSGRWAKTYGHLGARQLAQTMVYSEHEGPKAIYPHWIPGIIRSIHRQAAKAA